jgi:Secretion system C-terminal sorting domain
MMKKIFTLLSIVGLGFGATAQVNLGSAGNAFTQLNHNTNPVSVDPVSRSVLFIHRSDPTVFPTSNAARYRYDVSADGGTTFTNNIGDLNPSADNAALSMRYPNAWIKNITGSSASSNATLTYLGVYHNNGDWDGANFGTASLNNQTSTFTESTQLTNTGDISLIYSLWEGATAAGKTTFWAIAEDETYTGSNTAAIQNQKLVIMKGTLDHATKLMTWVDDKFLSVPCQDPNNIALLTPNIAFDPTGQKGWVSVLADIRSDADQYADSVYSPVFWKTIDGGTSWVGPFDVNLNEFPTLLDIYFPGSTIGATSVTVTPFTSGTNTFHSLTTAFDSDLAVDDLGRPHLVTIIGFGSSETDYGAGSGYTIRASNVMDISYDETINKFTYHFVGPLEQYRDTVGLTTTNAFIQGNRPQVGFNNDTKTVWFSYVDNDDSVDTGVERYHFIRGLNSGDYTGSPLFTVGIDTFCLHSIAPKLMTNVTGDSVIISTVYTDINADKTVESAAKFIYNPSTISATTTIALQTDTAAFAAKVAGTVVVPDNISEVNIIGAEIAPNPTTNYINVSGLKADVSTLYILDLTGKVIAKQIVKGDSVALNVGALSAGTYVIYAKNNLGTMLKKFSKN